MFKSKVLKNKDYTYSFILSKTTVNILPYRFKNNSLEFLILKELIPSWGDNKMYYNICGGGIQKNETIWEAAQRELLEETGYEALDLELVKEDLKFAKFTNKTAHLFTVDLTNYDFEKPKTDGSFIESQIQRSWVNEDFILSKVNSIFLICSLALVKQFKKF